MSLARHMKDGFTLIEIVVVIAVLAMLIALAIPNYLLVKEKAKEVDVKSGLHAIQLATETFAVDHDGNLPKYLIGGDLSATQPPHSASDPLLKWGYLNSYPRNPFVVNGAPIINLQEAMNDPLRPGNTNGAEQGYRFGREGGITGQIMGDHWGEGSGYFAAVPDERKMYNAHNEVDYIPYMLRMSPPFLPGQFMYSGGVLIGFGGFHSSANVLAREGTSDSPELYSYEATLLYIRSKYPEFTGRGVILILTSG